MRPLLTVMYGLRRGEILALRWPNVALGDNRRQLSIVESAEDQGRRPLQRPEVRPRPYRVVVIDYHYRIEGAPRPPSRGTITPWHSPRRR
jgi:hypothetical protein